VKERGELFGLLYCPSILMSCRGKRALVTDSKRRTLGPSIEVLAEKDL